MEKSESIKEISQALIAFHKKAGAVKKDASNPFFGKKYASLSNILQTINEALCDSGLSFTQFPDGSNGLITILMHSSGEYIQSTYEMKPVKDDPQGRGSALTYMRRYALSAVLGISIDEDDDANDATHGASIPESKVNGSAVNGTKLPWLNPGTKEYTAAVKKLKAGTTTIAKIKSVMQMTSVTETNLARDWKAEEVKN